MSRADRKQVLKMRKSGNTQRRKQRKKEKRRNAWRISNKQRRKQRKKEKRRNAWRISNKQIRGNEDSRRSLEVRCSGIFRDEFHVHVLLYTY
jgi:hypothetical protein